MPVGAVAPGADEAGPCEQALNRSMPTKKNDKICFFILKSIPFASLKAQNVMKRVPLSSIYFIIKPIGISVHYKSG